MIGLHNHLGTIEARCICKNAGSLSLFREASLTSFLSTFCKSKKAELGMVPQCSCVTWLFKAALFLFAANAYYLSKMFKSDLQRWKKYGMDEGIHIQLWTNSHNLSALTRENIIRRASMLSGSNVYPSAFMILPHHCTPRIKKKNFLAERYILRSYHFAKNFSSSFTIALQFLRIAWNHRARLLGFPEIREVGVTPGLGNMQWDSSARGKRVWMSSFLAEQLSHNFLVTSYGICQYGAEKWKDV